MCEAHVVTSEPANWCGIISLLAGDPIPVSFCGIPSRSARSRLLLPGVPTHPMMIPPPASPRSPQPNPSHPVGTSPTLLRTLTSHRIRTSHVAPRATRCRRCASRFSSRTYHQSIIMQSSRWHLHRDTVQTDDVGLGLSVCTNST